MMQTIDTDKILSDARAVLETNDMGEWTRPTSVGLYPHQWLWDSFFIAIGQRHYDTKRAMAEIRSPFRAQWRNGMVPHIIFSDAPGYHAGPGLWQCELSPDYPKNIETTGVTQPPMAAEAVIRVGEMMTEPSRLEWYQEMYPNLVRWHEWFYRERDLDRDGLVVVVLSWETGMDNSPPWMDVMGQYATSTRVKLIKTLKLSKLMEGRRKDTKAVPAAERITTIELNAVYDLIKSLRRQEYDYRKIMANHKLQIVDLTLNCILMRANVHLAEIAKATGQVLPEVISNAIERAPEALESLWDEESGEYYSRNAITGELIKASSISTFLPMYAQKLPQPRLKRLLEHVHNPQTYGTNFPIPSAPLNSPYFDPHRYWQGPTWVNMNWLIIDGLSRNGQSEEAEILRDKTLEMIDQGGMSEYFSPLDATKAGAGVFSWTAALAIDLLSPEL